MENQQNMNQPLNDSGQKKKRMNRAERKRAKHA
jgi:hypothetical protein